jgi:glycosyltransferase involved in cell wall biosynthesis
MENTAATRAAPKVAIAMATFDPDPDLFRRQVDSIRVQSLAAWVCVVSDDCSSPLAVAAIREAIGDDPRFAFVPSDRRRGAYRNFERALERVPASVSHVALADQDDRWHADKLETLMTQIGDANLMYSDCRVVDPNGATLAPTYWTRRRNNHTNLASLLIANTVTGGASLFRRELLELALPFPETPADEYHDHWIALVALGTGQIAYVDRPLYDYVQHHGATLGHAAANVPARERRRAEAGHRGGGARADYVHYLRLRLLAESLIARGGARLGPSARRSMRRFIRAERSPFGLLWLLARPARQLAGRNETMGAELRLVRGLAWRRLTGAGRALRARA